jgi:hypothetical protein
MHNYTLLLLLLLLLLVPPAWQAFREWPVTGECAH